MHITAFLHLRQQRYNEQLVPWANPEGEQGTILRVGGGHGFKGRGMLRFQEWRRMYQAYPCWEIQNRPQLSFCCYMFCWLWLLYLKQQQQQLPGSVLESSAVELLLLPGHGLHRLEDDSSATPKLVPREGASLAHP